MRTLLFIFLVYVTALMILGFAGYGCTKEIEKPNYISVTEYIDSFGTDGQWKKSWVSIHWHEPIYHRDSLLKYSYLGGQRYMLCPPEPIYSRWVIGIDTCKIN